MHYDITLDGKVLGVAVPDGLVLTLPKVRNAGSIAWIAELPDTGHQECYGSMDLGPVGIVFANTWLGYRVPIDAGTGRILGKKFTK